MSYLDIVKKYRPDATTVPEPEKQSALIPVSPALNAPKLGGYSGVVQKYKQQERKTKLAAAEEQGRKALETVEHPGVKETVKTYAKGLLPAAKQVITAPFTQPKETAYSITAGLANLGPTIVRAVGGITRSKTLQQFPNPGDTEVGSLIADKIKKKFNLKTDNDLNTALREATTLAAAYELGGGALKVTKIPAVQTNTVLGRVLGNVVGGQLTNETESVKERGIQAAFDAAFGLATEGASKGVSRLFRKAPKVEAKPGEITPELPKEIPSGVPQGPRVEPETILYKVKNNLGKDPSGQKVLAKTQVDSKTGRAIVYYDKSLDIDEALKKQVFDHEYGHILDKRLTTSGTNISAQLPNYKGNQVDLDAALGDFATKQNKKAFQVTAELNAEVSNFPGSNPAEKFANGVSEYMKNPKGLEAKSPTFKAFLEHRLSEPRFSERITTSQTLKTAPKAKEKAPEVAEALPEQKPTPGGEKPLIPEEIKPKPGEELPKIKPKKVLPEEAGAKIDEIQTEIGLLEETIDASPAKQLSKYVNRNGELPEIIGGKTQKGGYGATSEFGTRGDDIITELGFADDAQAITAYDQYKSSKSRLSKLKEELRSAKKEKVEDYTPEQLDRINALAQEATQVAEEVKRSSKFFAQTGLKTGKVVEGRKAFNPKSINAPDEVNQLFEQIGKEKGEFSSQRISKSNEDIKDLARLTGLTPEDLVKAKPGSIANAETVAAARQLVLDKAQDLMNHLKGVDPETATPAALKELKNKFVQLVAMQKSVAGLRTEASNVFRQFGIELQPGENATLAELGRLLKNKAESLGASPEDLASFSNKVAKEINLTPKQRTGQGALNTWYAAILSGPKTTARNILSTASNIVTELVSKAANPKQWKEIPSSVSGLMKGLKEGWGEARGVLTGKDLYTGKFLDVGRDVSKPEVFVGKWRTYGQMVESVGRFLNAQDKLLSAGAREMERASLKARGGEISKALEDAISKSYAESTVYHGRPKGRIVGALRDTAQTLRNKIPESKIIVPFVDTVANVMDRQFDYLPITSQLRLRDSTIMRQVERIAKEFNITSEADKAVIKMRLRDQQMGRMILGTAVSGAAVTLAAAGKVSGNGPSNFNEKNQLQDSGWRPNSIKIGDTWIPYTYLGPLAGIFAMAGNIHDKTKYDKSPTKDLSDLIAKGLVGWTQTQLDQSFLSGASDLFDVLNGDVAPDTYLKRLGVGLIPIPAAYTQTKDMIFRQQYETRDIQDKIKQKLGITGGLQPRLSALGEPVKSDLIYGITPSTEKKDPVYDFLIGNDLIVGKPNPNQQYTIPGTKNKRGLTEEEYTRYVEEAGKEIYKQLQGRIGGLKNIPDEEKKKQVEKIVDDIRGRVRMKILLKR